MERIAKQRQETRQHSAANDNGGHLVSLGRILVDPRLVAALDVWVEAQQEQSPFRSEAVSMAIYEWAISMGLAHN